MSILSGKKTWIEIDRAATAHNVRIFRHALQHSNILQNVGMLQRATAPQLWAVVKSNAYGHGLVLFSGLLDKLGVNGFCVDSVVEGLKLRHNGIRKPILVLGPTLNHAWLKSAKEANITLTVSNLEALQEIAKSKRKPTFHLKIDTGMHRQGFQLNDFRKIVEQIQNPKSKIRNSVTGIYTHFAMPQNRQFTERQFREFQNAIGILEAAGFKNLVRHAAATGGAIADPKYHLDAVRIGAGLYGFLPSANIESFTNLRISRNKFAHSKQIRYSLIPALSWHALVSEVKEVPQGEYIGYDATERLRRRTRIAIIPIGYWHGFPRALSSTGAALIRGRRAKALGRVSMDLLAVDATGIPVRAGDRATLIGRQSREAITADEFAAQAGTSNYEILTRLNPLVERIMKSG